MSLSMEDPSPHKSVCDPMDCGFTHLTIALADRKEGLEGGSKPNDVEETRWHQALENDQQGILERGKQTESAHLDSPWLPQLPTAPITTLSHPILLPPSSDNKPTASFPCLHTTPLFSKSLDDIWDPKH